jgi:dihydrofolate reductase
VDGYSGCDVYLLGRRTYELLWPYWSTQASDKGVGQMLNTMKKYVVSSTLKEAPWKESTIIRENVLEEITRLKQQPGKDILVDGSATLVQSLMETDLVDEYRLLVVPIIVGSGRCIFKEGLPIARLKLVKNETLSSGIINLSYQPDKKEL